MAHCFRDLGEAGHAAWYARRSLDMDRPVRARPGVQPVPARHRARRPRRTRAGVCDRPTGPGGDCAPYLGPQRPLPAGPDPAAPAAHR
jgi:hypothetical protein